MTGGTVTASRPGLGALAAARAIAVVGASPDPNRIGGRPIDFLKRAGFDGRVYPVNPKYTELQGLPCYPDLGALPGPIDVAIVAVAAREVPAVLREAARKGAVGAVIYSSGFAEVGGDGESRQDEIVRIARELGLRLIGPNCQGLFAFRQRLNLSFSSALIEPAEPGPVALVAQSGAVGGMLYALLREQGLGFSHWVSSGNEADVSLAECVEFFVEDPDTRVIGAYVESVRDGRRLVRAVERARGAGKRVALLRTGRSQQAARAARSHTGAIAAEDRVARALLEQAGAIDVADVHELVDCVSLCARIGAPPGRRIGLLSNSGGLGVIMSDTCADLGLELPPLAEPRQRALGAILPAFGATGNPVDVTAQFLADDTLLPRALETLLDAPELDLIVVALTMVTRLYPVGRIAADVVRLCRGSAKPVLVCWVASAPEGIETFRTAGVPVFTDPTRCLRALAHLVRDGAPGPPAVETPLPAAPAARERLGAGGGTLDEYDSKMALAAYGITTAVERREASLDSTVAAAEALGYPVALKVCSPAIAHKSDLGLVRLNLAGAAEVRAAGAELDARLRRAFPSPPPHRWLVQRMAPAGVELVLGAKRDPSFGPVVMAGLGGVFVEHFADVAFGLAPVTRERALAMLRSLRAAPLLAGVRGRPAVDEQALADALVRLSHLAFDLRDRIREVDVNPLIALPTGQGVLAVDALVVLDPAP
jgi:acyl-CoA synthetase (NDP forming)